MIAKCGRPKTMTDVNVTLITATKNILNATD